MTPPKAIWTEPERHLIRKHYRSAQTHEELLKMFPGKTWEQIRSAANGMGITRGRSMGSGSERVQNYAREPDPIDEDRDACHIAAVKAASRFGGGFPHIDFNRMVWIWPQGREAA